MFGIGTGEILLILFIAVLVVGPEKTVQFARQFGEFIAKFRRESEEVTREFREVLTLEDSQEPATQPAQASKPAAAQAPSDSAPVQAEPSPTAAQKAAAEEPAKQAPIPATPVPHLVEGETEVTVLADEEGDQDGGAVELEVGQLVPEDEAVEPTILGEPVLVADEEPQQEQDA